MTIKKINPFLFISATLLFSLACAAVSNIGASAPVATEPPAQPTNPTAAAPQPAEVNPTEGSGDLLPAQPLNERFYTQDFDEALKNWSYVLTSGKPEDLNLKVLDGYLLFDERGKNVWAYALYDEYLYTDVRLDVRVENMSNAEYQINLICRYDEHQGWWEFNIKNGKYEMRYGKWDNNKLKASYTKFANGASNFWNYGQAVNDIQVSCVGSELKIAYNGHDVKTAKDDLHVLLKGQIGVGISSFDNPNVLVRYDWVKIGER
jgi:hypothetical protein